MVEALVLLRPHQQIKNGFVLVGVLFAKRWDLEILTLAGVAFLAFCSMASAAYIVNDIFDLEADRQHPVKRHRPLASGQVGLKTAYSLAGALSGLALALAALISGYVVGLITAYALLQLAYSWCLKHWAVLDVFVISAGFMLRLLAGTLGLGIFPSAWLLLCGLMLTLFLGFAKRRAELQMVVELAPGDQGLTRRVLDEYTSAMVENFLAISAACTILTYSLYTVSPETVAMHGPNLIYTVPFVVYGIFRYLFLLHRQGKGQDTASDLVQDPQLLAVVFGWVGVTMWLLGQAG